MGGGLETDTDQDGVVDAQDNCPEIANMDQADGDGDGIGDVCDANPAQADVTLKGALILVGGNGVNETFNLAGLVPVQSQVKMKPSFSRGD